MVADVHEAGWAIVLLFLFMVTGTSLFLAEVLERFSMWRTGRTEQTDAMTAFADEKAALMAYYDFPVEKPAIVTLSESTTQS